MPSLNKIVFFLFFCFSFIFVASLNLRPYPFDFVVKAVPVFSLAVLSFFNIPGIKGKLLGMGFLFSDLGDILLELDRSAYFVFGLAAFLLAHLFYTSVFIQQPDLRQPRSLFTIVLAGYGIFFGSVLVPNLGNMMIPVAAYLVIIISMGMSAAVGKKNHFFILIGACLFIVSDSIIAYDKFISPVSSSSLIIMSTYYSAQFFIACGALKSRYDKPDGINIYE